MESYSKRPIFSQVRLVTVGRGHPVKWLGLIPGFDLLFRCQPVTCHQNLQAVLIPSRPNAKAGRSSQASPVIRSQSGMHLDLPLWAALLNSSLVILTVCLVVGGSESRLESVLGSEIP